MSHTSASFTNLWDYEGQNSIASSTSGKNSESTTLSPVKAELLKYYKKHGLESIAKDVGIICTNGEISLNNTKKPRELRAQIITLPVVNTPTTIAMTPFKVEPAILPKTVHLSNSPVILNTPQRVVASVINSSRTPQQLLPAPEQHSSNNLSVKRPFDYPDEYNESKRCKKGEKGGKGLRHFSMKVCEKVRKKGTTSYNEVADELVAEFSDPHRHMCATDHAYDQKNIRRRVYDALNVLMAMNIISKEKKEIKWLGLPTNSAQEYSNLEREKQRRIEKIKVKTQQLQELILNQISLKNLITRNREIERQLKTSASKKLTLPFVLLTTHKGTTIDCNIAHDKKQFEFTFNDVFQMHMDFDVLKSMGLDCGLEKSISLPDEVDKAKALVPRALQPYITLMSQGKTDLPPGMLSDANGIKFEADYFNDPSRYVFCELQEASSSSSGPGSEYVDIENTVGSGKSVLSRQSSVGSLSDLPSRHGTSTPSDDEYTDSDEVSMDGEESN